jgi:hypothetical protein
MIIPENGKEAVKARLLGLRVQVKHPEIIKIIDQTIEAI